MNCWRRKCCAGRGRVCGARFTIMAKKSLRCATMTIKWQCSFCVCTRKRRRLRMHKGAAALVRAAGGERRIGAGPVRDSLDEKLKEISVRLRAYQSEKRRKKRVLHDGGASASAIASASVLGLADAGISSGV